MERHQLWGEHKVIYRRGLVNRQTGNHSKAFRKWVPLVFGAGAERDLTSLGIAPIIREGAPGKGPNHAIYCHIRQKLLANFLPFVWSKRGILGKHAFVSVTREEGNRAFRRGSGSTEMGS